MPSAEQRRERIAARLRAAREMAGLSQAQVAKKLELHRPSISEMEAGRRSVGADELMDLAELYGVTVAWLTDTKVGNADNPRVELAARELARLKPKDVDRLLNFLAAIRENDSEK
jgi:transcriptional regulator with XRE-family HTH domain